MIRSCLLPTVTALCGFLGGCAAEIPLHVTDPAARAAAVETVCLIATDSTGRKEYCSAVQLSPTELLTCAHCLPGAWRAETVLPGEGTVDIAARVVVPLYVGREAQRLTFRIAAMGRMGHDWVLLRLDEPRPMPTTAAPYDVEAPLIVGDTLYLAGFPSSGATRKGGPPELVVLRGEIIRSERDAFDVRLLDRNGRSRLRPGGAVERLIGLSGGAAFVLQGDGTARVVGVCQQGSEYNVLGIMAGGVTIRVIRPSPALAPP